jgi:hypothetical protein
MNRNHFTKANRILLCVLAGTAMTAAVRAQDDRGCSLRSVAGTFGYVVTGIRNGVGPIAGAGELTFHRDGTISDGKQTVSFGGAIADETYSGTFTVNSDCSGSFVVDVASPIAPRTSHIDLVWVDDGNGAKAIFTDAGTILTAEARRLFSRD